MITDEGKIFLAAAKTFIDEHVHGAAFDKAQQLPRSLLKLLASHGYLGINISREQGGLGMNALEYGLFTELLGRACSSTRTLLTVHCSLVTETLSRWGTEQQKRHWFALLVSGETIASFAVSEPAHGSDTRGIATRYRKSGADYVISGTKKWISFGAIADVFLVFAKCDEQMSAFLIDRSAPGVRVEPINNLVSQRASHLAEITFDEVVVPNTRLLGAEGSGQLLLMSALDNGRYSVAWGACGVAREALVQMIGYAQQRTQFGSPLAEFQLVQGLIGDAASEVHAAHALCERAASQRMARSCHAGYETTIAKYVASKAAVSVTARALQVHGANGLSDDFCVERLFRDAKALEIIEGSSQMQQITISNYALTAEK